MRQWWSEFSQKPLVADVLATVERFSRRGGSQLAAAIAYYSVLSLVPILMLAFAALGLTITVIQPEAIGRIEAEVSQLLQSNNPFGQSVYNVIYGALNNWASIGLTGLGIIFWVGSGWVGNLKRAVRLLMREDVDNPGKNLPLPLDVLANFAGLIAILCGIGFTFAASAMSTWLAGTVGSWLGAQELPGWSWLLRGLGLLVSLAIGVGLFRLLFAWFAPAPVRSSLAWIAAGIGSTLLVVLLSLTGYLIGVFSRNLSTAVFGSTIVLMLFMNLFATLLLYVAAWLAIAGAPRPQLEPGPESEPEADQPVESLPGELYVSSELAQRTLGIGLKTGYVVGAATGVGIGATLTAVLSRLRRNRR